MAHKIGAGNTRNGRKSNPSFLGLKCTPLQKVKIGTILVRQRGMTFKPGINVNYGKDYTLFALREGQVQILKGKINIL